MKSDHLGKGKWNILFPDKVISKEVKTENDKIFVTITCADGTTINSVITNDKVNMNINRDYIVKENGTIEILK